jgi:hypothetical protein
LRSINDPSRKRIIEKSHPIDLSVTAACDPVHEASQAVSPCDAWVSPRDGFQAHLFGHDCAGNNLAASGARPP